MNYYHHMNYGFGPIEFLFHALLWILIIAIVVKIVRKSHWHGMHGGTCGICKRGSDALEILKQRYAKGEINKQEFEEKKSDIIKE